MLAIPMEPVVWDPVVYRIRLYIGSGGVRSGARARSVTEYHRHYFDDPGVMSCGRTKQRSPTYVFYIMAKNIILCRSIEAV